MIDNLNDVDVVWNEESPDLDGLADETGDLLIKILKKRELTDKEMSAGSMSVVKSEDELIAIYTYYYDCGGTAREIYFPIIQWKNKTGKILGAYKLYPTENKKYKGTHIGFSLIHKLTSKDKQFYLLEGGDRGSTIMYASYALVIQIKDPYLILDYPAFLGESSDLTFYDDLSSGNDEGCIACMDYDSELQEITIPVIGDEDSVFIQGDKESGINQDLKERKSLKLRFNGRYFEE